MIEAVSHVLSMEGAVVGTTSWLAYVTMYPYHVRRRHRDAVKRSARVVYVLCCHHGRWVVWRVVALVPGRLRDRP